MTFWIYLQCINLYENPKFEPPLNSHLVYTPNCLTGLKTYICMKINLKARNLMKYSEASSEQRTSSEPEINPVSIGDPPNSLQPAKGGHGSRGDKTPRHHSNPAQIHSESNPNPSRITLRSVPCSRGLRHHADTVFLNIIYQYTIPIIFFSIYLISYWIVCF